MSNKFLKILGICVLIVMLPVLIAVSAVCLTEDNGNNNNGGGDTPTPTPTPTPVASYTVYSNGYADNVKISEKDGKWTLETVPTRSYYALKGLNVKGNTYTLNAGVVEFAEGQETTFEADVAENNPITTVWTCDFTCIALSTYGYLAQDDVCLQDYVEKDTTLLAIEDILVFNTLGYQFETKGAIETVNATLDTNANGEIDDDDTYYELTFTAEDKTEGGDVKLNVLLNKLVTAGATLTANSNGYIEIELAQ